MQIKLSGTRILLASEPVDFRKAIDGLCSIISEDIRECGIYIFYNKARNKLKILGWHGNGFVLLYKRLETGHFTVNRGGIIKDQELSWLLAGLDWESMSSWGELKYRNFC